MANSNTNDLARQAYEQIGTGNAPSGSDFVNFYMQSQGAQSTGQFPTASGGRVLNQSTRQADTVYVRTPTQTTVTSHRAQMGEESPTNLVSRSTTSSLASTAETEFNNFVGGNSNSIRRMQDQLVAAGYLATGDFVPGVADANTKKAYQELLGDAADDAAAGKTSTIQDILDARARALKANPMGPGSANFTGTRTETSTNRTVDYTNPSVARAHAEQSLGDLLGHDPTQAEFKDYLAALHAQEAAHPSTSTSTTSTSYKGGIAQGSHTNTTTQEGGADPAMVAETYAYQHHGGEVAETGLLELLNRFHSLVNGSSV